MLLTLFRWAIWLYTVYDINAFWFSVEYYNNTHMTTQPFCNSMPDLSAL